MIDDEEVKIKLKPVRKIAKQSYFNHGIIMPSTFVELGEREYQLRKLSQEEVNKFAVPDTFNVFETLESIIDARKPSKTIRQKTKGRKRKIKKKEVRRHLLRMTQEAIREQTKSFANIKKMIKAYGTSSKDAGNMNQRLIGASCYAVSKGRGRPSLFPDQHINSLRDFIFRDNNKGLALSELKEKFENEIGNEEIKRLGLSYWQYYKIVKGKRYLSLSWKRIKNYSLNIYREEELQRERSAYARKLIYYISEGYRICYIDESSLNLNFRPNYGWGNKGKALRFDWLSNKSSNYTYIGMMDNREMLNWSILEKGMHGPDFYEFLLRTVNKFNLKPEKTVFVMDNLGCHKMKEVYPLVKDCLNILFLPRASPMFNPIEYFFSYLKGRLRKSRHEDIDMLFMETNATMHMLGEDMLSRMEMHTIKLLKDMLNGSMDNF